VVIIGLVLVAFFRRHNRNRQSNRRAAPCVCFRTRGVPDRLKGCCYLERGIRAGNVVTDKAAKNRGEVTQSQDFRYVKTLFMRLRAWWHRRRSRLGDRTGTTTTPPTE
jgi:hypothetical protein